MADMFCSADHVLRSAVYLLSLLIRETHSIQQFQRPIWRTEDDTDTTLPKSRIFFTPLLVRFRDCDYSLGRIDLLHVRLNKRTLP